SDAVLSLSQAKEALIREGRRSGLVDEDRIALQFLTEAAEAFVLLQEDPASALTSNRLHQALETLGRVPLIGTKVASAVKQKDGEAALQQMLGPYRTWIHRTLASITDERVLQKLLLRLMQAQMPLYAQIRHGPLEYGKDIAVLVEDDQALTRLEMYQVKAG